MFCVGIWRGGNAVRTRKRDSAMSIQFLSCSDSHSLLYSLHSLFRCIVAFSVFELCWQVKSSSSPFSLLSSISLSLSLSPLLSLHSADHPSKCARWIMRKIAQIIAGIISEKNTPKAWNYSNWRKMCCRIMYNTYECLFSFAVHSFLVHFSWAVARHFAHFRYACFPASLFSFRISNRRTIFKIGERCSFRKIGANASRYFLVGKTFWTRKDGKWFVAEKYTKN